MENIVNDVSQKLYNIALNDPYISMQVNTMVEHVRNNIMRGELVTKGYTIHSEPMRYVIKCSKVKINNQGGTVHKYERKRAARLLADYIFMKAQENIHLKPGY